MRLPMISTLGAVLLESSGARLVLGRKPVYSDAMSLTAMQELFIKALLADPKRNGTAAAVAAGYSPRRAKKTARELMDDPEVQLA